MSENNEEQVEEYVRRFEEKLQKDEDGKVKGVDASFLENVYLAQNPQAGKYVYITSFDGGDTPEEFAENMEEVMPSVITVPEYRMAEKGLLDFVPHETILLKEMPPEIMNVFGPFIEEVEKFGEDDERTVVLFRYFETAEDGKPMPVDYSLFEDIEKMRAEAQGE